MTEIFKDYEIWFVTGSQHLYGEDVLKKVADNSKKITAGLDGDSQIPAKLVFKQVVTTSEEVYKVCRDANSNDRCAGLVLWMHTFSPSKMWIRGLGILNKPYCHLHTQFGSSLPYGTIDMDFMNLNQSAHGGREFGFINGRMRLDRKVIVGHWEEAEVREELGLWTRVALAWADSQGMRVCRFGDNMREVAVTEGNKVGAQIDLGYEVSGYGIGDLLPHVEGISDSAISARLEEFQSLYKLAANVQSGGDKHQNLRDAIRIELGITSFMEEGGFKAFTTTFENLYGLKQLPGMAAQSLMAKGYGFGAEGDWKTAALLRTMKVMGAGLKGATSFMEDYTYHMAGADSLCLGAHMLEVCPTIAGDLPVTLECHPLGIGGKDDPTRFVFNVPAGKALNASLIDLGNRFRLIVNTVEVVDPPQDFPKLPVARALWKPMPNLKVGAAAWIYSGAAHHSSFSQAVTVDQLRSYADMAGMEMVVIDEDTKLTDFRNELRWNEAYYGPKSWNR
jgi:L-arabinose isomerase